MSEPMAMSLLEDWCRGMGLDIHRSLLVTGIPEHCSHAEIEETLNGVLLPLGTYRVVNKIFLRQENVKAALVEVSEGVNLSSVPREFPGKGSVWKVVCRDPTQDAEFLKNLNEFLDGEGRTWEDVVRLLRLNQHPSFPNPNQPPPNWAEAMGLLLGAVVQVIFYMNAEMRNREEEARAEEAELMATWASTARRMVKKEPGLGVEVGSTFKMEDRNYWKTAEDRGDSPKPLFRRAGGKIRSRRRKQKKNPKQEPICWRKPQGNNYNKANLEGSEAAAARNSEIPESVKNNKKPFVKQEETVWKKKRVWKDPNDLPRRSRATAEGPGNLEDSDQEGGPESPPKKKAMTWATNKIPIPMRKKKKMGMGSLSYVLIDSEATKNMPVIPKKGPGSRRAMLVQRAPRGPQPANAPANAPANVPANAPANAHASASSAQKTKPGGFPHVSKDSRKL
ncbi:paraneoplastic antigen-like protein 8A [Microtus ochrogaster]|uniref:Paraneoplastic antigen-like protein 8A n=1 Tax=Microtus ochrogaster TaxID=79684 RepID=A0ABM0L8H3_MICOH|nr:paraneoplastic antigen-like protein 8A [Microtus ochrogaster]XP_005361092.1 paraneoplastic antigen-like protein 8A [Microtus ochrogaster]XP_005361093.1 paraneoplastic antigen-like protein 8A [Microtus ochrogaster]